MYPNHTHPPLPCTSRIDCCFPTYPTSCFLSFVLNVLCPICVAKMLLCVWLPWSVVNSLGATSLKKTDCPIPGAIKFVPDLPYACARTLSDLNSFRLCRCCYNCGDSTYAPALLCPVNIFFYYHPSSLALQSVCFLFWENLGDVVGRLQYWHPLRVEHTAISYCLST